MEVTLQTDMGPLSFTATSLEVATLLASVYGWEVDVEPMAGSVKVTARRGEATIKVNGNTVGEAADKLIRSMTNE